MNNKYSLFWFFILGLFCAQVILLALKLIGLIKWTWILVFTPLWVWFGVGFCLLILVSIIYLICEINRRKNIRKEK